MNFNMKNTFNSEIFDHYHFETYDVFHTDDADYVIYKQIYDSLIYNLCRKLTIDADVVN